MTRKLDKEHLEEIQSLREQFASISSILGSISIEEYSLQRQLEHARSEQERYMQQWYELQEKEQKSIDKLRTHYGDGQINIADGTFTPGNGLEQ